MKRQQDNHRLPRALSAAKEQCFISTSWPINGSMGRYRNHVKKSDDRPYGRRRPSAERRISRQADDTPRRLAKAANTACPPTSDDDRPLARTPGPDVGQRDRWSARIIEGEISGGTGAPPLVSAIVFDQLDETPPLQPGGRPVRAAGLLAARRHRPSRDPPRPGQRPPGGIRAAERPWTPVHIQKLPATGRQAVQGRRRTWPGTSPGPSS